MRNVVTVFLNYHYDITYGLHNPKVHSYYTSVAMGCRYRYGYHIVPSMCDIWTLIYYDFSTMPLHRLLTQAKSSIFSPCYSRHTVLVPPSPPLPPTHTSHPLLLRQLCAFDICQMFQVSIYIAFQMCLLVKILRCTHLLRSSPSQLREFLPNVSFAYIM